MYGIPLASLNDAEYAQLLSALGHHVEVLETDAWDDCEEELRTTRSLLGLLLVRRNYRIVGLGEDEWEILDGAVSHHEEVYYDAVQTEDNPEPWLTVYRTTRSLRSKIGG